MEFLSTYICSIHPFRSCIEVEKKNNIFAIVLSFNYSFYTLNNTYSQIFYHHSWYYSYVFKYILQLYQFNALSCDLRHLLVFLERQN